MILDCKHSNKKHHIVYKDYDKNGERIIVHAFVCNDCYESLEVKNLLVKSKDDEIDWFKNDKGFLNI